jgi:predicted 2-oxoglutarate/Fe(II)-dependent dioxygenase YbiX
MEAGTPVLGGVLRAGREAVDTRMRSCTERQVAAARAVPVVEAMTAAGQEALSAAGHPPGEMQLDGPKFCAYGHGEFFRAHVDRSADPRDPDMVRTRSLSLVCFLNGVDASEGLSRFDGGTLVLYVPASDGSIEPVNIRPSAGTIVTFPSDVMHEVRPVRRGVRYTAVAWYATRGGE